MKTLRRSRKQPVDLCATGKRAGTDAANLPRRPGQDATAEFDVRLSRRPIERLPMAAGRHAARARVIDLIGERKRHAQSPCTSPRPQKSRRDGGTLILCFHDAFATAPGLQLYRDGKYGRGLSTFSGDLKNHPDSPQRTKMQFDAGTAAYKMGEYSKAIESFSQHCYRKKQACRKTVISTWGRTLEERADMDIN